MDIRDALTDIFTPINEYAWYFAFVFLIGLGIIFTILLKGQQITKIGENAKLAFERTANESKSRKISSFEAFCIGMGARIGVGNIAGVATAIATGGPGAIFWMWIFAIIGAASSFMESTLAQIYKEKKSDGSYHGGPAYYARKGLRRPVLGAILGILIFVTFGIGFVGVQASNSSSALCQAFNFDNNEYVFGIVIAALAAIVIFGGVKRVAKLSAKIVPIMALAWMVFATILILCNIGGVVNAFAMIFEYAFKSNAILGGGIGSIILVGLKRGVFSNEAGLGSVANVAATAKTNHPIKQAKIQSFGVLVDTLIVCTFTAIAVLSYGDFADIYATGLRAAPLVQFIASETFLGDAANIIIAVFLFVFAFTSMIGYYTMSESNVRYVKDSKALIMVVRVVIVVVAFTSCLISTAEMDLISDTFMAIMGAINMVVVALLSKKVFECYKDWREQKAAGVENPVFNRSCLSDPVGVTEWWGEVEEDVEDAEASSA